MSPSDIRRLEQRYARVREAATDNAPCPDREVAAGLLALLGELLARGADELGIGDKVRLAVHYLLQAGAAVASAAESDAVRAAA